MSSAANVASPGNAAQGKEAGKPRPNPVALEAMVSVTGANASEDGQRHLFSEETTTVLVFKDGAVIRLAAPVSVGQLLFLTNKKSNQEVVCQVLKKRSFKPPQSYVELQFTEERADYWGVAFPEGEKSAPEFKAADQVQAEETTAEVPEAPVEPQSAEAVNQLKAEVETLREQLWELEKKNVEAAAAKAMAEAAAAREAAAREAALREAAAAVEAVKAQAQARAQGTGRKFKEELAPAHEPAPIPAGAPASAGAGEAKKEDLLMPPAQKDHTETARAVVNMALPVWKSEKSPEEQLLEEEAAHEVAKKTAPAPVAAAPHDAAEDLLPKPALDFSKAPKSAPNAAQAGAGVIPPVMPKRPPLDRRRVTLLSVLLLTVLGAGAWYGNWLSFVGIGTKPTTNAAGMRRPNPVKKAASAIAKAVTGGKTDAPAADAKDKDAAGKDGSGADGRESAEKSVEQEAAAEERRVAARERAASRKNATQENAAQASSIDVVPVDAPVLPAKLLKPVNPVYPPDAMRSYITGDVKAELVVEASGRVGEVKVISGPKALRDAAVEALKQYQYAPATQGGKAVESKAVEVVKFWFNP